MTHRTWSRLTAVGIGVVGASVSVALAATYVAAHDWFGAGDIPAFVFWNVPYAGFLAVMALVARPLLHNAAGLRKYGGASLLGLYSGLLWTIGTAAALGGWIGAFSFPILYVWMVGGLSAMVVWGAYVGREDKAAEPGLDRDRTVRRIVGIVLGAPIGAVVAAVAIMLGEMLGSVYVWDRAEPEIHLIPAGFEGPVLIVFNDPSGEPPLYEGRTRVYRIPQNGLLRTQFSANQGWNRPAYLYVDDKANSRVSVHAECTEREGDVVQVCTMPKRMSFLLDGQVQPVPDYDAYVVGRWADHSQYHTRGDSLVSAVLFAQQNE